MAISVLHLVMFETIKIFSLVHVCEGMALKKTLKPKVYSGDMNYGIPCFFGPELILVMDIVHENGSNTQQMRS